MCLVVRRGYVYMKRVIILTSDSLRHSFMRKAIALDSNIRVLRSYCERQRHILYDLAQEDLQTRHLTARDLSEKDFFESFVALTPDYSNPVLIEKNEINESHRVQEICSLNPDLIIAYGCSIIKPPLIKHFTHKILNVHLGLSPYYRGSGTNYFPFVNNELECVGATFMYMDEGIDTGDIIHQIQATIYPNDTNLHQIGNRLISKVAQVYRDIINHYENLDKISQPEDKKSGKLYKNKDFTPQSLYTIYENIKNNMILNYLKNPVKLKLYQNPYLLTLGDNK